MSSRTLAQVASAVLYVLLFVGPPAFADLAITTQTWVQSSTPAVASPEHADADPFGATTQYISEDRSRSDFFGFSQIKIGTNMYLLNRAQKSYIVGTGDASQLGKFLSAGISQVQSHEASATETVASAPRHKGDYVDTFAEKSYIDIEPISSSNMPKVLKIIDTGRTTSYLGHSVCRFIEVQQVPIGAGSKPIRMREVILSATDFPPAEVAEYKKACADNLAWATVPGVPLKITTYIPYAGLPGYIVTVEAVTAISTKPLPASVFAIPAGYIQAPAPKPDANR